MGVSRVPRCIFLMWGERGRLWLRVENSQQASHVAMGKEWRGTPTYLAGGFLYAGDAFWGCGKSR